MQPHHIICSGGERGIDRRARRAREVKTSQGGPNWHQRANTSASTRYASLEGEREEGKGSGESVFPSTWAGNDRRDLCDIRSASVGFFILGSRLSSSRTTFTLLLSVTTRAFAPRRLWSPRRRGQDRRVIAYPTTAAASMPNPGRTEETRST